MDIRVLGERLKLMRTTLELQQKNVAESLEVSVNVVSRVEAGANTTNQKLLDFITFYDSHFDLSTLYKEEFILRRSRDIIDQDLLVEKLAFAQSEIYDLLSDLRKHASRTS